MIFVLTAEIKTMTMNKDDIDYDGMGNQGRVPVHDEDKKDYFIMSLVVAIFVTWSLIIISMFI